MQEISLKVFCGYHAHTHTYIHTHCIRCILAAFHAFNVILIERAKTKPGALQVLTREVAGRAKADSAARVMRRVLLCDCREE